MVLATLRKVEERGAIETAHRLRQRISAVFVYGIASGVATNDPAASLGMALMKKPAGKRWPAVRTIEDARAINQLVDVTEATPTVRMMSRLLALTAQRPGMVRTMLWEEIRSADFKVDEPAPDAVWYIPAQRIKLEFDLRDDESFDYIVPLAPAAVELLRAIRPLTGGSAFVFPGLRSIHKPSSENALSYLYARLGLGGRHVPHGWRSTFSTIMNEIAERKDRKSDRLVIDLMLAHRPHGLSATELRYNRSRYMDRRRELADEWAKLVLKGCSPAEVLLGGRRRPRPT